MSEPLQYHALMYEYVPDVLERRGPFREEHLALAREWKQARRMVMGGPLGSAPPTGALFVFSVTDPSEVEEFVAADPYVINAIVTSHSITSWTVVI